VVPGRRRFGREISRRLTAPELQDACSNPNISLKWAPTRYVGPRARHTPHCHPTMSGETGYHRRGTIIGAKIFSLLSSLGLSTYDEVSPVVAYWIEYALTEQSVDTGDLVERLSLLAWENRSSEANAAVAKFLKEFRDAPHRSEQARSCVDRLCDRVLRWFAAAAAENLVPWDGLSYEDVARYRGNGFTYAASFVGHLTECGILDHDLVRKHLIKPLITHRCTAPNDVGRFFRSMAIYQIFVAARDTLLQGFLEPEDVEACFKTFGANPPPYVAGPDAAKLNVRSTTYPCDLRRDLFANL